MDTGKLLDLGQTLGDNVISGWDSGAQDPGVAFLNGEVTTVFAAGNQMLSSTANAVNMVSGQMNTLMNTYNNFNELLDTASQLDLNQYKEVIKTTAMNILKAEVKDYSQEKIKQMTSEMTSVVTYFATRTAYWTGVYSKGGVSEIMALMMSPVDTKQMDESKDNIKNDFTKKITEIKAKTQAITDVVTSTTKMADEAISSTLTYMKAGPKFVETNLNKYLNLAIKPVQKEIDKKVAEMVKQAYDASEEAAKSLGKIAGDKVTNKLKQQAEKQKAKIEMAKVTVISFAKAALDLVKKLALSLIGG